MSEKISFKEICKNKGVNYYRALKRRKAGLSEEKIFKKGYIRNQRKTIEIKIYGKFYPNLNEAIRCLNPPANRKTISRWVKKGLSTEEAFERIPNPGYADGIIYLVTNKYNEKIYIGLTIQSLKRRWKYHVEQSASNKIKNKLSLHEAIRQYGEESFKIEKIDSGCTKKDLEAKERLWIKKLNTPIPDGYNISLGGTSGGSNKKETKINNITFPGVREATEYLAKLKNISYEAAKKRISVGRIHIKKPAKKGESLVKTKAYKAWGYIIYSALNPKSRDYIPNITIHEEWRDFHTFHKDAGDPLFKNMAFARVNKDKGFFPGNCFWLTKSEASKINGKYTKENGKFTSRKQKKF
ncbi:hypothetical protein [uncultured Gammaproteobacteria bacterium]|nr:hypothetical protein [uncultured Gammaproteobacteria bacterium]